MRPRRWTPLLMLGLLLLSSCFSDYKLTSLDYTPTSKLNDSPRTSGLKIFLGEFVDERTIKDAIYEEYVSSKEPKKWIMREPVTEFLKNALEKELQIVGFEIVTNTAERGSDIPRLEGKIRIFYSWTTKSEKQLSAVVNLDFSLSTNSYRIYSNSFYSQKTGPKKYNEWRTALLAASQDVTKAVAESLKSFLTRGKVHEQAS